MGKPIGFSNVNKNDYEYMYAWIFPRAGFGIGVDPGGVMTPVKNFDPDPAGVTTPVVFFDPDLGGVMTPEIIFNPGPGGV